MLERLGTQRLLALFAAGWLLFNFPLLALWDHDTTLWGLPLFPVALFGLWGGLIAAVAWTLERGFQPGATPGATPSAAPGHTTASASMSSSAASSAPSFDSADTTEPPERR